MMAGGANIGDLDEPIVRQSVAEQVAGRILELIKTGALKAGDQLPPERELAASLHVSRPSVREAIRGLTILGVVRTRQGGGAYISNLGAEDLLEPLQFFISLDKANVRELYETRMLIESEAARMAAKKMSDDQITRLEAILAGQDDLLGDPIRFRLSDSEFHSLIWDGSGNAVLKRIGQSLHVMGLELRRVASETPDVLTQSVRDHHRIVAALKARDPEKAAKVAASHLRNVYKSTISRQNRKESET